LFTAYSGVSNMKCKKTDKPNYFFTNDIRYLWNFEVARGEKLTTLIGLTKLFSPVKCKYRLNYICTSSRPLELDILSFDFYCLEKQLFLQELLVFCFCFEWKLDAVYSLEYVRVQTDIKSREKWYQRKRQTTHPCWLVVEISRFWLLKGNIYFHSRYFS
jgi:hypothetical protein